MNSDSDEGGKMLAEREGFSYSFCKVGFGEVFIRVYVVVFFFFCKSFRVGFLVRYRFEFFIFIVVVLF